MYDELDPENSALVGILFGNKVIFNMVDNDGDFNQTGKSIITFLKTNNNKFVSLIIESQSYNGIKYIFDDKMIFKEFDDSNNKNIENLDSLYNIIERGEEISYLYIYDFFNDILLIKIPDMNLIALDYKNSEDVRSFGKRD